MSQWTKPSGLKVELNDEPATIEYAKKLGWTRTRGRPAGSVYKNPDDE